MTAASYRWKHVRIATLAVAALGCAQSPLGERERDAADGLSVVVDSIVPRAGMSGHEVFARVGFSGAERIGLVRCSDDDLVRAELERAENGGWTDVGGGLCSTALYAEPIRPEAGDSFRAVLGASAGGRYRVSVSYSASGEFEGPWRAVRSEEFQLP